MILSTCGRREEIRLLQQPQHKVSDAFASRTDKCANERDGFRFILLIGSCAGRVLYRRAVVPAVRRVLCERLSCCPFNEVFQSVGVAIVRLLDSAGEGVIVIEGSLADVIVTSSLFKLSGNSYQRSFSTLVQLLNPLEFRGIVVAHSYSPFLMKSSALIVPEVHALVGKLISGTLSSIASLKASL